MIGAEIAIWRKKNKFTQVSLSMTLDVTRQTISAWENSKEPLPVIVGFALLALEHLPHMCVTVGGKRMSASMAAQNRNRPDLPGSKSPRPNSDPF